MSEYNNKNFTQMKKPFLDFSLTYQSVAYPGASVDESELIESGVREYPWQMYRQKDDLVERSRRPAFSALTAKHMARLARCLKEMLEMYQNSLSSLHARTILDVWRSFRDWKKSLPHELSVNSIDDGDYVLPHVCSMQ